ncbi:hypothetical protein FK268_09135 [Tsukamurella sputi]|uniref:Uncharacterized protein n=1 Tax=Tsukamurella sputi TaxID=2591848 RepID=A0A5C5RQP9_9ACTN|nr:hypothetical protein [Tsukamurella sputi]TWS25346.1 hypothetical protein FK268_09135 [Tsukamurella sputi]
MTEPTPVSAQKIPDLDDAEGQRAALVGALSSALITSSEIPTMTLAPMLQPIADQLLAYGVRQTDRVDPDAVHAPSWLREGAQARAVEVPEQVNHHEVETEELQARVAEAPPIPKKIPKAARATSVVAE